MKKLFTIAVISMLTLNIGNAFAKDKKFGKEITKTDVTKVSEVLNTPEKYLGKSLLIEGTVLDVCTKRGCWMEVSSDKKRQKIKIKVRDGEMVFPQSARGKKAKIQGKLFQVKADPDHNHDHSKGHKHEHGKDDKHAEHKSEQKFIYMFKPEAVEIN